MTSFSLIFYSMGEPFQIFVMPLLKLIKILCSHKQATCFA